MWDIVTNPSFAQAIGLPKDLTEWSSDSSTRAFEQVTVYSYVL